MANPNPRKARTALAEKRKREKIGSISELQERVWKAVNAAESLLSHEDPNTRLRAVHAITQAAASYVKVLEAAELEARVKALEAGPEKSVLAELADMLETMPSADGFDCGG